MSYRWNVVVYWFRRKIASTAKEKVQGKEQRGNTYPKEDIFGLLAVCGKPPSPQFAGQVGTCRLLRWSAELVGLFFKLHLWHVGSIYVKSQYKNGLWIAL